MPTYEYLCKKCGHKFENFQSMTSAPIKKCPKCGKNAVQRLISAGAGLIFKGSGFYITDYRDASYTDKAKAESTAASTTADTAPKKDGGSSTEAKPAAAEAKPAADAKPATAAPSKAAETKPAAPKSASKSAAKARTKK